VKDIMQRITSPIRKSSLSGKQDKNQAQDAAKQVLATLTSTKHVTPVTIDSPSVPKSLPRPKTSIIVSRSQTLSTRPTTSPRMYAPDQETTRGHLERSLSESAADYNPADIVYQHDESALDRDRSFGPQVHTTTGHARRLTDPGPGALRARLSRLSEVREDRDDDNDEPSQGETNYSSHGQVDTMQGRRSLRAKASYTGESSEPQGSERLGESSRLVPERSFDQASDDHESPPSYRPVRSPSGKSRASYLPK